MQTKTLAEIVHEWLDGQGLAVTDPARVLNVIRSLGYENPHDAVVIDRNVLMAANHLLEQVERWNAGKTHDIGAAFEELTTALANNGALDG